MATITYAHTIKYVAEILEEDPKLLQAIVSNYDTLSYGNIISIRTGDDESVTALTDHGMEELEQMLSHTRRSTNGWNDFLDSLSITKNSSPASKRNLRGNSRRLPSFSTRRRKRLWSGRLGQHA
jgi:hypothetical protein